VWACLQEAFRDHRGHHDIAFDEWWAGYAEHPEWTPELSTVVTQDDEVVAAAMVFQSWGLQCCIGFLVNVTRAEFIKWDWA